MWTNILAALYTVLPMFLIVALGHVCRRVKLVDTPELRKFNMLGFRIFLPCHLFRQIYNTEMENSFEPRLAIATVATILTLYFLSIIVTKYVEKDKDCRSVMIQSIFRSNFIIMGLPLVTAVFGNGDARYVPMMYTIVIPSFNVLAVILLESFYGQRSKPLTILWKALKNPLVVGATAALLVKFLHIPLDEFPPLTKAITSVAQIASPLLLFILGASFDLSCLRSNRFRILFSAVGRLIVAPLIGLGIGTLLALPGEEMAILLSVFIAPTASTTYAMAQQMGGDTNLAGGTILFSTLCSCVTMSVWIALLRQFIM
ncbi:MAG: AEC family transporter [Oscillibacter sp.]|nr:AEC family transporter [Oscillibacter sp.]